MQDHNYGAPLPQTVSPIPSIVAHGAETEIGLNEPVSPNNMCMKKSMKVAPPNEVPHVRQNGKLKCEGPNTDI